MSALARKPCIRELIGTAVNASRLEVRAGHESPLERIAALGAAGLAVRYGADIEDVPIAAAKPLVYGTEPDPRDVLAGDLVPMLFHIRYGDQHGMVPKAIELFARWIAYRPAFAQYQGEAQRLLGSFAERVLHEWLSDRCTSCGGSGKHQRSQSGKWLKPWGSMQRNATFRPCGACNGSRRATVRHPERMRALGLTREQYEEQRWPQRFNAALWWLGKLLPQRIIRALTAELERRKRQP